jgi:hypothetical protein
MVHNSITTPTSVSIPASNTTHTNIPDFFATITPKRTNSKIYITARWFGEFSVHGAIWNTMFGIKRGETVIGLNPSNTGSGGQGISMAALSYHIADADSTPETMYLDYYDSPSSASALTYRIYASSVTATTLFTNRTVTAGSSGYEWGRSTITLWEIAQ